jgi:hypothetical protein
VAICVLRNKAFRFRKQTSSRCSRESQSFRWHFSLRYSTLVVEVSDDDDDDDDERLHYDDASRCARYIVWCGHCWSTTPPPRNSVSQSSSWASSNRCVGWLVWLCGSHASVLSSGGGVQRTHLAGSVAWPLSAIGWPSLPEARPSAYTNRVRTFEPHCSPAKDQYCCLQRLPLTKLAPRWSHSRYQ